ncbi:PIN domain-containing protein [bacterium]|nr:PIN domain-containing protein [bacterium]
MVVVDTNVLVSAFISPGGTCAMVLDWLIVHHERWIVTPLMLEEYRDVLLRPAFALPRPSVERLIATLERITVDDVDFVEPCMPGADEEDRRFWSVALTYGAAFLITGNGEARLRLRARRFISQVAACSHFTGASSACRPGAFFPRKRVSASQTAAGRSRGVPRAIHRPPRAARSG